MGLLAMVTLTACSSDDDASTTQETPSGYQPGYWVLNEGGFGTIDYLSYDLNTLKSDAFTQVNGMGEDLGQFVQSVFFHGDYAYVISNGSNKITVVNRATMQYVATIAGDLVVPRYGVVVGDYAYVTNSNSFASLTDDFLTKIDLTTNTISGTIQVNSIAERIVHQNGKLYVSDGFFGSGNGLTVIDVATGVQSQIALPQAPNSIQSDGTYIYVLSSDFQTTQSQLFKIRLSDHAIVGQSNTGVDTGNATNLVLAEDVLYFNVGRKIYHFSTDLENRSTQEFFTVDTESNFAGYGLNVLNNKLFIGNSANDFSSNGELKIYDTNGNLLKEVETGVGPNGIYDNN